MTNYANKNECIFHFNNSDEKKIFVVINTWYNKTMYKSLLLMDSVQTLLYLIFIPLSPSSIYISLENPLQLESEMDPNWIFAFRYNIMFIALHGSLDPKCFSDTAIHTNVFYLILTKMTNINFEHYRLKCFFSFFAEIIK